VKNLVVIAAILLASCAFTLGSNQDVKLYVTNLNLVWVDATVNGEGVEWIVET
jgi:hypothetical protein